MLVALLVHDDQYGSRDLLLLLLLLLMLRRRRKRKKKKTEMKMMLMMNARRMKKTMKRRKKKRLLSLFSHARQRPRTFEPVQEGKEAGEIEEEAMKNEDDWVHESQELQPQEQRRRKKMMKMKTMGR